MSPLKVITSSIMCVCILAGVAVVYYKFKDKPAEVVKNVKTTKRTIPQKGLPPIVEETTDTTESSKPVVKKNTLLGATIGYDFDNKKQVYSGIIGKRLFDNVYLIGKASSDLKIEAGLIYAF